MVIYFGADHGGFGLKERLKTFVKGLGYEISDMGALNLDPVDDFPDFASKVGEKVSGDPQNARGIVICRSGAGVDIVANKFKGVRSVLGLSADHVFDTRRDVDANVLAVAADFISPEDAEKMTRIFLETPAGTEERYARRLNKIKDLDNA